MPTQAEVVAQLRQSLGLSDPELDTSIGSVTRKILDTVAEVIAESYADQHLLNYQYDIDAKAGSDLDDFVALFGFGRLPAKRATGVVRFSRSTPSPEDYAIAFGTSVATTGTPPLFAVTTVPALLQTATTATDVPVQAAEPGLAGNVGANTLVRATTPVDGVTTITNPSGLTGGADFETDEELRLRFRRTIFRSIAGTEQNYLGVALEDEAVTRANVIGASKRYRERIQGPYPVTSTLTGAQYVYPKSQYLGTSIDDGAILTEGVHYTFDSSSVPPEVDTIGTGLGASTIYELDFEYAPSASRNDPENGISNRVDVWVNGERAVDATQSVIFRTAQAFNNTTSDPLYRQNFRREDGTVPTAANYFVRLAFVPLLTVPNSITVSATTYNEGTDYWIVHDDTAFGYAPTSMAGLEWKTAGAPADASVFSLTYQYNDVPRAIEENVRKWRLVATDARVHQAKQVRLKFHLAIMYTAGSVTSDVNDTIDAALSSFLSSLQFGASIQASDIIDLVHGVSGVDNVRLLTSTDDGTNYAIQQVSATGSVITTYATGGRAKDVVLGDAEVPVFFSAVKVPKAGNTFGVL